MWRQITLSSGVMVCKYLHIKVVFADLVRQMNQETARNLYPLSSSHSSTKLCWSHFPLFPPLPFSSAAEGTRPPAWIVTADLSLCHLFPLQPISTEATNLEMSFSCWRPHWFVVLARGGRCGAPWPLLWPHHPSQLLFLRIRYLLLSWLRTLIPKSHLAVEFYSL